MPAAQNNYSPIIFMVLSIFVFVYFISLFSSKQTTDIATRQSDLLSEIDNSQTLEGLVMTVEQVLSEDIKAQSLMESSNVRAIIWNEVPSGEKVEIYFDKIFNTIKYDKTYQDLAKKNFDYTGQYTSFQGKNWEKFLFIRTENEYITLFLSYTMRSNIDSTSLNQFEKFFGEVSKRMFNKLHHPSKSLCGHRRPSLQDKSKIEYFLVKYDVHQGFIQQIISSIEDGLIEQEEIDKKKQSSCILKIENGQNSLHSIRYSIQPGFLIPDFHAFYKIQVDKQDSTIHNDL
uniref:Uncharacterized protein n=1 Tax=Adineta vaga TaxID=104782 RepID=B3G4F6_ADIVA|nr:unknown [Adineta vaga]